MPLAAQPLGNFLFWCGGTGFDPGQFGSVNTLTVAPDGRVFTCEDTPNRAQTFSPRQLVFLAVQADINQPQDPFDINYNYFDGNLYMADHGQTKVSVWQPNYTFVRKWGVHNAAPTGGQIAELEDVICDGVGNVCVSDVGADRVNIYDTLGNYNRTIPSFDFFFPKNAALSFDGTKIIRADNGQVYDTTSGASLQQLVDENGSAISLANTVCIPPGSRGSNLWVIGNASATTKIWRYETKNFSLVNLYTVDLLHQISQTGVALSLAASPTWGVSCDETLLYLCNWDTPYVYSFSVAGNRGPGLATPRGRGASW